MAANPRSQFDEEEDDAVPLQRDPHTSENTEAHLSLVGRFLTRRPIRISMMKDRLAAIWQPGRGVNIKVLDSNLFLYQFYHRRDVEKVYSGGPWHFDGHMLILSKLGVGDVPTQVTLNQAAFWVQVHDVPIGFMTEAVGRILGNFIGEFVEYDPKNSSDFWKSYMRIRVLVDVRKPLRRGKKINVGGDNIKTVRFKYERLSVFCYLCGVLGHLDNSCDLHFDMEHDDGSRGWGPELKVEKRNPGENNSWLRKEGGAPPAAAATTSSPAGTNQTGRQGNYGNNYGNNGGNYEERFQALNVHNSSIISAHEGRNNIEGINSVNHYGMEVTHSTNHGAINFPGIETDHNNGGVNPPAVPRHSLRAPPRIVARDNAVDRIMHACMEVDGGEDEEVRKRKRLHAANHFSGETSNAVQQASANEPFLSAGPGSQACQEQ